MDKYNNSMMLLSLSAGALAYSMDNLSSAILNIPGDRCMNDYYRRSILDMPSSYSGKNYIDPKPISADNKIGRNEKCPCGSGLKYKKCCLIK